MENQLENRSAAADASRSNESQARATQAIRDVKPSNRVTTTEGQETATTEAEREQAVTALSHDAPTVAGTAPVPGEPVPDDKETKRQRHLENARQKRAVAANASGPDQQKLLAEA